MTIEYLLDANIVSDLIDNPRGRAAQRLRQLGTGGVCTSIIVAAEVRFGIHGRASARLQEDGELVLSRLTILPFEAPADLRYAELRTDLQRRGTLIGANDLWIAAHALALGCTLVTANEREFRRVPGLKVENWLD